MSYRRQSLLLQKQISPFKMLVTLLLLLLLLLLLQAQCMAQKNMCKMNSPLRIPHGYFQPGDFVIGGIVSYFSAYYQDVTFHQSPDPWAVDLTM